MMNKKIGSILFCLLLQSPEVLARPLKKETKEVLYTQNQKPSPFQVEVLVEGLGIPWGMVFLNPKELLLTERSGKIKKIHISSQKVTNIQGGPKVHSKGQGGLLDVALHPNFKNNQWIYFTYSIKKGRGLSTALARGKLKGKKIKNLQTLFTAKPFSYSKIHFGSRLAFDKESFLFMSIGDRGERKKAQSLKNHYGKLLRLTDKGKAPGDNPFVKKKEALREIWSFGHRNPQGLFIHKESGEIYLQEHGPKGGDEINLIQKGKNYGWPVITYGRAYSGLKIGEGSQKKGMEQPLHYWTPSIAPSGLMIYSGKKFPKWKGDFFSGALVLRHLNQLKIKKGKVVNEKRLLAPLSFRIRNVIEGPQGFIYVAVDRGMILKISPLSLPPL